MSKPLGIWGWLICALCVLESGCGGAPAAPQTGTVTGIITENGNAVVAAEVRFLPDKGPPASAKTDQQGKYTLLMPDGTPGASVGPNRVLIVTGTVPIPAAAPSPDREVPLVEPTSSFQYQFAEPVTVKPNAENTLDFELQTATQTPL